LLEDRAFRPVFFVSAFEVLYVSESSFNLPLFAFFQVWAYCHISFLIPPSCLAVFALLIVVVECR